MKFHKECKVLHLRRNNPGHQYMLGADWLENSLAENDLEVLAEHEPARCCCSKEGQQCLELH